jgi:hypothetical protein
VSDVPDHTEMLRALVSDLLDVTNMLDRITIDGQLYPDIEQARIYIINAIQLLQEKYE